MLITVETLVRAPIAAVWKAWTTPEDIVQWNTASPDWHTTRASVDLRVGGRFCSRMEAKDGSMGFDFEGEYTEIVEQQLLVATFGGRSLRVAFIPGEAGVTVRETFEAETTFSEEQQRQGWQAILESFARHVEANPPGVIR
ncbi:MAG: SRPBCC family protein [Burkholderiaceae bacterium]|nr:SRPBCC family protein [Burkholderiaceae bacterium]